MGSYGKTNLAVSIILGCVAAIVNVLCSIGIKKHPENIWIGLAFAGFYALSFLVRRPTRAESRSYARVSSSTMTVVWLLIESVCGMIHVITQYFVLFYLRLGDAIVLANGLQMFGMIAGEFCLLSRKPSKVSLICACSILLGVMLVAKPPFIMQYLDGSHSDPENEMSWDYLIGVMLCSVMSFTGIVFYTLMSKLSHVTEEFHIACQGVFILVACLTVQAVSVVRGDTDTFFPCSWQLRTWAVYIGTCQFVGQSAATFSSQMSTPVFALIIRLVVIPIGYVVQLLYLREAYSFLSLVGGALIVCAIIGQSLHSILKERIRDRRGTVDSSNS